MPKYKCLNKDCEKYDIIEGRNSKGYYNKELGKVVDTGLPCPICGKDCELQLPEHFSRNLINRP